MTPTFAGRFALLSPRPNRSRRFSHEILRQCRMIIRFNVDAETGLPHIYGHNVTEKEVDDVMRRPGEIRRGEGGSMVAIGQTEAGRYLRVIYVPDPNPSSIFVITAYDLKGKPLAAYRRRRYRRKR